MTVDDEKSGFRLTFNEWYLIQAKLNDRPMTDANREKLDELAEKLDRYFGV